MSKHLIGLILAAGLLGGAVSAAPVDLLVQEAVETELGHGLPAEAEISVALPDGTAPEAEFLSQFWIDEHTGHFITIAVLETGVKKRIEGLARIEVPVAVPHQNMMPGAIVTEGDLRMVTMPHASIGSFAVIDPEDIVGKQVRRVLRAGRPVMEQSLSLPLAVTRGERVTLLFNQGGLRLSAPGRALSDAYQKDPVRVVNQTSNKTVTGIARGNGLVEIEN